MLKSAESQPSRPPRLPCFIHQLTECEVCYLRAPHPNPRPVMKARLVVFPIKGRNWCFCRSLDPVGSNPSSSVPSTVKELWKELTSDGRSMRSNAELVIDFVSDKMNRAWINMGKAPAGTVKSRIHDLGLKLLSRVKPSEDFLKSVSKDITKVDITYPASLSPRLVRQRIRHVAKSGFIIHRRYFYGSATLLPFASVFMVLPLPNIPFFWLLFRAYSHWRALQGSERLLSLVSDCPKKWNSLHNTEIRNMESDKDSVQQCPWALSPSEELERVVDNNCNVGLTNHAILSICREFHLGEEGVLKYRNSL